MNKKIAGIVLIVVGVLAAAAALFADLLGIGGFSGFGTTQIIMTVVGFLVLVAGVLLLMNKAPVKK